MTLTIKKWGNSLAVRLPKDIAAPLHLEAGTPIALEVVEGGLFLRIARSRRRPGAKPLSALLESVTPEGTETVDWGQARGQEAW